jgi:predicted neuraminidase
VKNKPITLSDGTILAPASLETPDGKWDCFTDSSQDNGKTWQRSAFASIDREKWPGEGAIQPSLINFAPGKVSMLARSSAGFVARADSEDNGKTWGEMYLAPLHNNNSGLDALRLENGTWLVVHNPVNQRWVCQNIRLNMLYMLIGIQGPRTPLVISSSVDEGKTWKRIVTLEDKTPPDGFKRIVALDTVSIAPSRGLVFSIYRY